MGRNADLQGAAMRRSEALVGFDRQIKAAIKEISEHGENIKAAAADRVFDESRQHNAQILGYAPGETLTVDGTPGRPLSEIDKLARLDFELQSDIIPWTVELLRRVSPRSGLNDRDPETTYSQSWAIISNGQLIDPRAPAYDGISRIYWINVVPYARKIAGGLARNRPNGWLESSVLPQIKRRYNNLFVVGFAYPSIPGLSSLIADFGSRHKGQVAINRIERWPVIWADPK